MFKTRQLLRFGIIVGTALLSFGASANSLTFAWTGTTAVAYDGTAQPVAGSAGPAYLTAVFEDIGVNQVKLTITANMVSPADVEKISFNVTPDELANNLVDSNKVNVDSFSEDPNNIFMGSVHTFDLLFDTGSGSHALSGQQVASVVLSLKNPPTVPGLTLNAYSFDAFTTGTNTNTNQSITLYAAAHFQNIGKNDNDSSWISTGGEPAQGGPLPGTPLPHAAVAGSALFGVLALTRRRRTSNAK